MPNTLHDEAPPIDLRPVDRLLASVETAFRGKRETVRMAVAALLARGHILLEDVPGVGKTTLARSLAQALGASFRRIQFTSDLLPSDVLGAVVYNPNTHEFSVRPGPIFSEVVLADEINRAPPRTQSGLLEAMEEGRVTIDDRTLPLPRPFLVIATQNPLEQHGTYPLPESQLDRFLMRLSIGYPEAGEEREILLAGGRGGNAVEEVVPVLDAERVLALQARAERIHADPAIVDYLMRIVQATRESPRLRAGASTRGSIALLRAAKGYALVDGRSFLTPDDVQRMVIPCLAHRVLPAALSSASTDARSEAEAVLERIVASIPVPV